MYSRRVKHGVYVLEGTNSVATALFFNYYFFFMREVFGFTNLGNLFLCAVTGLVYTAAAWFGGQFAQRRGYWFALRVGFSVMAAVLIVANSVPSVPWHFAVVMIWTMGMALTWPALEALTSEGEPRGRLPHRLGIYNVVWSSGSALANFSGGAVLEKLGHQAIFFLPAALHLTQLLLLGRLEARSRRGASPAPLPPERTDVPAEVEQRRSPVPPAVFLQMAWVANPFAYIAMNAVIPVIPRLAERFGLSPMFAGFACSVWYIARAISFAVLWQWTGWHYRFRWLASAYVGLIVCFTAILLAPQLWMLLAAQVVFGFCVGLMYCSSLYYSMDVGQTKGEHGGFHEAAIGVGILVGPAVGAGALRFFPASPHLHAWAVTVLLGGGLVWLVMLRRRGGRRRAS